MISHIKGRTLNMFDNGVQRRMFGRKRDEVTGAWRKLHSGELHKILLGYLIKEREMGETCSAHEAMIIASKFIV
jgi:hypothetical protein